jgi:hypothetical protein
MLPPQALLPLLPPVLLLLRLLVLLPVVLALIILQLNQRGKPRNLPFLDWNRGTSWSCTATLPACSTYFLFYDLLSKYAQNTRKVFFTSFMKRMTICLAHIRYFP